MRIPEKVAVITGSGTGIGRGIAKLLAQEGASIVVADVNGKSAKQTAEGIISEGGKALAIKMDVTSRKQIYKMVKKTLNTFGKIDILVNNAGVSSMAPVLDMTERDWDYNMNINAKGTFLCTQPVLKEMIKQGKGGKIICIASIAGKFGNKYYSHYSASKFAIIGFVKSIAMEVAPYQITVNAVCPGRVQTSMEEREIRWEAELLKKPEDEIKKRYAQSVPLGRLETPEDVAKVVLFLASEDSDYMTGVAVDVTGGMFLGE